MRREEKAMHDDRIRSRPEEQGSALIIATLVAVILSLLGISYLMMAQTESTIAENERNGAMALYVAEAGGRLVVNWFNDPSAAGYLVPTSGQIDRTLRLIDDDNNPATQRVLQDGSGGLPRYKQGTNAIFDRPYRPGLQDAYIGVETGSTGVVSQAAQGPDLVVTQAFLDTLNNTLFPNFPSSTLRAKITRIEIYSPPILNLGGQNQRMGIATVKIIGGVLLYPGTANERQIATRVVKAVVNEIPVPGPVGPLQSCATLNYTGDFKIHWGAGSSQGNASIPGTSQNNMDNKVNTGMPYALNDPFTYVNGAYTLAQWAADHDTKPLEDPWFKFIAGGTVSAATGIPAPNPADPQPWPFTAPGNEGTDHSNIFQNTVINCPTFDYAMWKSIAQTGDRNHFYYKYDTGGNFKLDGAGTSVSFVSATSGKGGLFFFDTVDSLPPNGLLYTDALSNLTPDIDIPSASGWNGVAGFVYLNSKTWASEGAGNTGSLQTIVPPGEPFDGSGFVNLDYPSGGGTSLTSTPKISNAAAKFKVFTDPSTGEVWCTDATTCTTASQVGSGVPVRDDNGLPFQDTVVLDGVLYTSGAFSAKGNANYFGSLVAQQGVLDGGGTPGFYFDERLIKGQWPPKGLNIPRVIVTAWQTDL